MVGTTVWTLVMLVVGGHNIITPTNKDMFSKDACVKALTEISNKSSDISNYSISGYCISSDGDIVTEKDTINEENKPHGLRG